MLLIVLAVVIVLVVVVTSLLIFSFSRLPDNHRHEKSFLDDSSLLPSLEDEPQVDLTVVIPAYNEEARLPSMLTECLECLQSAKRQSYEVIVVDDGSRDATSALVLELAKKHPSLKCLKLVRNRGKGHAVKMGFFAARGRHIFFADADRAMPFSEFQKIFAKYSELSETHRDLIVVGSRAHLEKESMAERSFFRTVLMKGFHSLVWLFCVRSVRDTQCGYKLFSRSAVKRILPQLHIQRWAFDVELLFIAEALEIKVEEVAIKWEEIGGSKVTPIISWIEMGRDLVLIWIRYTIGYWRINK